MAPDSHNSNSSNHADNGAHQYNHITTFNLYGPWPSSGQDVAMEMFKRAHPLARELGSAGYKFLYDQVMERRAPVLPRNKPASSNAVFCFLKDGCFSDKCYFDVDLIECISRYPTSRSVRQVMHVLKTTQVQALSSWTKSKESTILLLDRHVGRIKSTWTTDFTLEVIGRITHSNVSMEANQRLNAVVTYFCDQRLRAGDWRQDLLLQDFLIQICRGHNDSLLAHHNCDSLSRADEVFHERPTTISQWWHLFQHCVTTAKIKSLYVLLDNIDSVHNSCDDSTFKEFVANLQRFSSVCQEKSVPVKLLVTSSTDVTKKLFQNLNLALYHIKLDCPPTKRMPY